MLAFSSFEQMSIWMTAWFISNVDDTHTWLCTVDFLFFVISRNTHFDMIGLHVRLHFLVWFLVDDAGVEELL